MSSLKPEKIFSNKKKNKEGPEEQRSFEPEAFHLGFPRESLVTEHEPLRAYEFWLKQNAQRQAAASDCTPKGRGRQPDADYRSFPGGEGMVSPPCKATQRHEKARGLPVPPSTRRASSWYRVPLGTCCHCREKLQVVCGNDVLYFAELWISLEEHQDALELIMSKYRKQMLQLLQGRKGEDAEPVLKVHQANSLEIESQIDRICEMGEVMRKAMQVDDDQFFKVQEKLAQLELENKELRELLSISKESFEVGREDLPDCEA
ncbi:PREDICTED: suppressor of IKBKE 1 [Haliaeetus leucocephalus]|nr:PREDICTED: suppressor of IKBKE 1 [Haliaeetus leucocephalus]